MSPYQGRSNNTEILETQLQKRPYQNKMIEKRRIARRCRRFNTLHDHHITRIPRQIITNDPLVDQFFNGSHFY